MRTTKFSTILASVSRIYGESALTADDAAAVAASLDTLRIEQVWSYANWRELDVIEERYYTANYDDATTYQINDIVYYPGTDLYYRCASESTGNLPTDESYWLVATGFSKNIPFVQAGKTPIGTVNAVTLHDPRLIPSSANVPFIRREDSIQVSGMSQASVWVRFTRRAPRFTSDPYSEAEDYAAGDLVYHAESGHCYQSLQDGNIGQAVTDPDYWQVQLVPYFAQGFLIRAALADLYDSQDQDTKADRHEAKAYEKLSDAYDVQNRREGTITRAEVLGAGDPPQNEPNIVSNLVEGQSGDFIEIE